MFTDSANELRIAPFVNQNQISAVESTIEIKRTKLVSFRTEVRKASLKFTKRSFAVFSSEIPSAPRVVWFVNRNVMLTRDQFAGDPAKEMGVTMVPIRNKRVIKKSDLHAA